MANPDIIQQAERLKPVEWVEYDGYKYRLHNDCIDIQNDGRWQCPLEVNPYIATALRCHVWMQALAERERNFGGRIVIQPGNGWVAVDVTESEWVRTSFEGDTLDLALASAIVAVFGSK